MANEDNKPQAGEPTEPQAAQAAAETTPPQPAQAEQAPKPEMTLDAALKELKEARSEAAKYRTEKKAAEKKAAEEAESLLKEQGEYRKLYEKLEAEHKAAQETIKRQERLEIQRKLAAEFHLKESVAKLLPGDTEEEMRKAAAEVAADYPTQPDKLTNDAARGRGSSNGNATYGGMTREQAAAWLGVNPKDIK